MTRSNVPQATRVVRPKMSGYVRRSLTYAGLLSVAARTLPIGTAYPVWVGIGAAGAVALGIAVLGELASAPRLFFLVLLLVAIVGLKMTGE